MSKRTLALILFLVFVTAILLSLALTTPKQPKVTQLPPTPTPMSPNALTTLSLMQASATESSQTAQYSLDVQVGSDSNKINGVQIELSYDPKALMNVSILPGKFFQQPTTLLKNIDVTNGRISYALAEQLDIPGHVGLGTVAILSFDKNPAYLGKSTTITFLTKSAVSADKILESVLKKTTDYTVTFATASGVPTQATTSAK